MFKYELHCHTKEVSRCGRMPAADIVQMYEQAGWNGIVITDHFSPMTFDINELLFPQRASEHYLRGYRAAKAAAHEGFTVLLGMELRYYATINDYLVYGIDEDFIKTNGNLLMKYPRRFIDISRRNGLITVQAHPFRKMIHTIPPRFLDGCEIRNGKDSDETNARAAKWAEECSFPIRTAGSDFHGTKQFARAGIETDREIRTNAQLLEVLRTNEFNIIGG